MPGDALVDAADEARVRQHREMRVEQVADLLGRGAGQSRGFGLQLAQLLQRDRNGLGEAVALGFDLGLRDVALVHRKIAALADMGRADGDPRRDAEARQPLFGAGVLRAPSR